MLMLMGPESFPQLQEADSGEDFPDPFNFLMLMLMLMGPADFPQL